MTVRIKRISLAYGGWVKVRVATLSGDDGVEFTREIEHHGNGVAVLPYDAERRTALLVSLPRAPVLSGGETEHLLEAPAGLLDAGEEPSEAARREAMEEAGVELGVLEPLGKLWSMPGISTERMDLFLAPYRAADRKTAGGGLAAEHENITVLEMRLGQLAALADRGALTDMKTFTLLQTLRLRRPELFIDGKVSQKG